ncbi:MAG: cytidylate kinase-like family protein [Desulfobacterales bacterium]|jgi:cytidylate kinase
MAIITISRDYASGGRKVGRILAKRLGYQFVDKSLFQKIAEDLNVSERTLESYEKSREYRISDIFSKVFDKGVVEEKEYQNSLKNLILKTAEEDDVVIIGRAAYYFLKDIKNCYHFHMIAPMDWRKKYAVKELKLPADHVQEILEKSDINHLWFHRLICGNRFDDPFLFHLTLNMGFIPVEKAVEVIISIVNAKDL